MKKEIEKPQSSGVVEKAIIINPKKPNSASRRCLIVRLPNGKRVIAYVPGEGHNIKEFTKILVRRRNRRDLSGVNYDVIRRGEHSVKNRRQGRSKYGTKKPKT